MYVIWVEFTIQEDKFEAFVERVKQQAADSLALESECHQFDVMIEADNTVALYEIYTDEAAFQVHLGMQHFKNFDAEVKDWLTNKTVRSFTLQAK